jgi:hypothetical protein
MQRILIAAFSLALSAAPAFATVYKFEFANADGSKVVVSFNDADNTSDSSVGGKGTATWNEATNTICGKDSKGDHCVTLDKKINVGESTGFKTADGVTGTATLLSAQ